MIGFKIKICWTMALLLKSAYTKPKIFIKWRDNMDAKSLVLMEKENGILTKELGSYEIEAGLEYVYKAFVEEGKVNLFLTTPNDVNDEEFNEIFDRYDFEFYAQKGYEIEEVEDEYNPVWVVIFDFSEEHEEIIEMLNETISYHEGEIKRILDEIK